MAAPPGYDPSEFQEVLRAWMDRHGLSQMAAGQTIGISQGIINRWLKPRGDPYLVQPTIESLEKLEPFLRIPLIQLKRMTGNLSTADLDLLSTVKATKPNNRLETFLNEIRAQWAHLEETAPSELQQAEDVTRVAFRLHHGRTRKPRRNGTDEKEEGGFRTLLMTA